MSSSLPAGHCTRENHERESGSRGMRWMDRAEAEMRRKGLFRLIAGAACCLGLVFGGIASAAPSGQVVIPKGQAVQLAVAVDGSGLLSESGPSLRNAVQAAIERHPNVRGFPIQINAVDATCGGGSAAALAQNATVANSVVANAQNVAVIGHACSLGGSSLVARVRDGGPRDDQRQHDGHVRAGSRPVGLQRHRGARAELRRLVRSGQGTAGRRALEQLLPGPVRFVACRLRRPLLRRHHGARGGTPDERASRPRRSRHRPGRARHSTPPDARIPGRDLQHQLRPDDRLSCQRPGSTLSLRERDLRDRVRERSRERQSGRDLLARGRASAGRRIAQPRDRPGCGGRAQWEARGVLEQPDGSHAALRVWSRWNRPAARATAPPYRQR